MISLVVFSENMHGKNVEKNFLGTFLGGPYTVQTKPASIPLSQYECMQILSQNILEQVL